MPELLSSGFECYCNIIYNGPDYVKKQIMVSNKKEDIPTDTRGLVLLQCFGVELHNDQH